MIKLIRAIRADCQSILEMQITCFKPLLDKYKDYYTSPANEMIEDIYRRFDQNNTEYYLITFDNDVIGAVRVIVGDICRISPIFIMPDYQGYGFAKETFEILEKMFPVKKWTLDTIKQEERLCKLYESLGYKKTGKYAQIQENMTIVYYEKEIYDL
ncbi:MAG: GNAT family N-acetyltransferase [Clostridiales bacterium]|nr:GNAT family N-acetyltransferase [Clostridiales bacterium]